MTASPDKIEAVSKVSEALNKPPLSQADDLDRVSPNREHFQQLMDSPKPLQTSLQRATDGKLVVTEGPQNLENNPIFAAENTSSQKSGSATDQEQNKRQSQGEEEEVEEVSATDSKKKKSSSSSLMDEVQKLNKQVTDVAHLSPETLKKQAQDVISQIDQVKAQLSQSQGEIKPGYQTLLRNRLTHIDDNLRIALSKAGVEYTAPPSLSADVKGKRANPIEIFISWLSHSQHQLENLNKTVDQLGIGDNSQLSPASMLTMQIKIGHVQHQIELFTNLLNKALEGTKTILNVQV